MPPFLYFLFPLLKSVTFSPASSFDLAIYCII